jgi:hypothetical protein
MVSSTVPVWAQQPDVSPVPVLQPGESDVGAAISPMKKGQVAPFTGVLLSPAASAKISVDYESLSKQIKIAVDQATAEAGARCDARVNEVSIHANADKRVADAQLEASKKENVILNERIKKQEDDRPNVILWLGGGFLAGLGAAVVGALVSKK